MLDSVSFEDAISGPVAFPSLIYLSLHNVKGLKHYISAPCLVTYHEGGRTVSESFYTPWLSLVEYGVYNPCISNADPAEWHLYFPNILRLSLRAGPPLLVSILESLAKQPHSLPALRTISVGPMHMHQENPIPKKAQETMESLVLVRSEASHMDVVLCFQTDPPSEMPIFFGDVSGLPIRCSYALLMHTY